MRSPASRHRASPDRHHHPPKLVFKASVLLADARHPRDPKHYTLAVSTHETHREAENAIMDHIVQAPYGYGVEGTTPKVVVGSNIFSVKEEKEEKEGGHHG